PPARDGHFRRHRLEAPRPGVPRQPVRGLQWGREAGARALRRDRQVEGLRARGGLRPHRHAVMTSTWLVILSLAIALGAPVAYALLLQVPLVRNHPEGYVLAFAVAAALAGLAVARARIRRW